MVVIDHHLGEGMTGVEAVAELRTRGYDGPILLFTQFFTDVLPRTRLPLDVWPIAKANPDAVLELLDAYRTTLDA